MARLMMVQTMSMWCRKSERSVRGWTDAMAMCARRYSVRRGRVCARCCRLRLRRPHCEICVCSCSADKLYPCLYSCLCRCCICVSRFRCGARAARGGGLEHLISQLVIFGGARPAGARRRRAARARVAFFSLVCGVTSVTSVAVSRVAVVSSPRIPWCSSLTLRWPARTGCGVRRSSKLKCWDVACSPLHAPRIACDREERAHASRMQSDSLASTTQHRQATGSTTNETTHTRRMRTSETWAVDQRAGRVAPRRNERTCGRMRP